MSENVFKQNELKNNLLLVILYVAYIFSIIGVPFFSFLIYKLLYYFGTATYGFISRNPLKSYLAGFFLYPAGEIANILYYHYAYDFVPTWSGSYFIRLFVLSVLFGVPGYLMAQPTENKTRFFICVLLAFVFIAALWFLTPFDVVYEIASP